MLKQLEFSRDKELKIPATHAHLKIQQLLTQQLQTVHTDHLWVPLPRVGRSRYLKKTKTLIEDLSKSSQ